MFSCVEHDASSKSETACLVDFYQEISTTSTVSLQTLTTIKIDRVKIDFLSNKMCCSLIWLSWCFSGYLQVMIALT